MNKTNFFKDIYKANIDVIKAIEKLSIENDMLDTQEYLDWKDELNALSLDLDR